MWIARESFFINHVVKPNVLKTVGKLKSFDKIVGGNPDIIIERGEIILKGAKGTFRGKTLKTGLKAEDYF